MRCYLCGHSLESHEEFADGSGECHTPGCICDRRFPRDAVSPPA